MKTRGERQYINMPVFAARLYDNLTSVKGVHRSFEEISEFVRTILKQGKLLDIGTGPGRLLFEINKRVPQIDLHGIDISASMVDVARNNLKDIKNIDLRVGNIAQTDYPDNYFDCIISTGSFYNWDDPVKGLNEMHRILKPGSTAYIFDTHSGYDKKLLVSRLNDNLKGYNYFRKKLSKFFLRKQLSMTYSISEYDQILKRTKFMNDYNIQQIELGNLPIYVRLGMKKI
jgi:ubiquinone/menaquinone biosynthesis C-methylase UbiE